MTTPDDISNARTWLEDATEWEKVPQPLKAAIEGLVARYAAHVTAEKDAEIEKLAHDLCDAEGALWRVFPNTHTIEVPGDPYSQKPDPFEGPGETYADAYKRVNEELEIWKSVFPDIAPERVLPDRSKLEARLANKIVKLRAEIERLRGSLRNLVETVDVLIAESEGVYGLRLDGTPSLWEELTEVGWLSALEEARTALNGEKADD